MAKRVGIGLLLAWGLSVTLVAQAPRGPKVTAEEFEAKLGYQTGVVALSGGLATIDLPANFRFIGPQGAQRLLTEGWGNPPDAAREVLGMLVPAGVSPLAPEGWGIVITFDEDGFVNDNDAATINYTNLLKELQEATTSANEERQKQGFGAVTLVGWAEPPSYDATAHKLYWAKELAFNSQPEHTLNYNIRILGRRGVLVLNAVAGMDQLATIRKQTQNLLPAVEFAEGHRYADYLPGKDKAAAYGIAGLILGATAAKAGFFKLLIAGILAAKKLIVAGVIALVALLKKLFSRGSKEARTA
jgi:uncharacterized membrane-anchored protein